MSNYPNLSAIILAAGQGTRMRSALPKVLHRVGGLPLIEYSVRLANALGALEPLVVVGHQQEEVRRTLGSRVKYAEQFQQLGTGHAVLQALPLLDNTTDSVFVWYGDMPLLREETLRLLVARHRAEKSSISMLTLIADDPRGFGRIVRDAQNRVIRIVEERDATAEQLSIRELNAGVYCFESVWLKLHLPLLQPSPSTGELYLTDLIEIAAREGTSIVTNFVEDPTELLGINNRVHLAEAERVVRRRVASSLMLAGVTMLDPATTYVDADVQIGPDSIIGPNTSILAGARVGARCRIGPNAIVRNALIGDESVIEMAVVENVQLPDGAIVGPFQHLSA